MNSEAGKPVARPNPRGPASRWPKPRWPKPRWLARRWPAALALCLIAALLLAAHRAAQVDGWLRQVIVTGPSMQPTVWGPSKRFDCENCGAAIRFHLPPREALPATLRCWNCGTSQTAEQPVDVPGDRVTIDRAAYRWQPLGIPLWQAPPQRGDLVAVTQPPPQATNADVSDSQTNRADTNRAGTNRSLQVKRILAVPGDRLSLRGNELLINGRRVADGLRQLPLEIVVHTQRLDAHVASNRSPAADAPTSRWRWASASDGPVQPSPVTSAASSPQPSWLVYHHESVHDGRPDTIRDDYPCNVTASRRMNPVERFAVTLDVQLPRARQIRVMCWQSAQPRCFAADLGEGRHHLQIGPHHMAVQGNAASAVWREVACDADSVPVDAQRPLAIAGLQLTDGVTLQLTVTRQLHWYVDAADRSRWPSTPLTLGPNRYFIAGDNQPISIDSRAAPKGIHVRQIVGRVRVR
ncbi:S26 family signal peptidase [Roseimaritima ulvae]|uniref:S26 family signal peptidase n=1 Tax=Roseimaritima ulvae TaxID=980254 RepID=UPI00082ADE8B|nr:S26 family signal peptidase [Roseimaritima ulvae]